MPHSGTWPDPPTPSIPSPSCRPARFPTQACTSARCPPSNGSASPATCSRCSAVAYTRPRAATTPRSAASSPIFPPYPLPTANHGPTGSIPSSTMSAASRTTRSWPPAYCTPTPRAPRYPFLSTFVSTRAPRAASSNQSPPRARVRSTPSMTVESPWAVTRACLSTIPTPASSTSPKTSQPTASYRYRPAREAFPS